MFFKERFVLVLRSHGYARLSRLQNISDTGCEKHLCSRTISKISVQHDPFVASEKVNTALFAL